MLIKLLLLSSALGVTITTPSATVSPGGDLPVEVIAGIAAGGVAIAAAAYYLGSRRRTERGYTVANAVYDDAAGDDDVAMLTGDDDVAMLVLAPSEYL